MFEVREETARALFQAQQRCLQGRLRLDVSSRCSPADTDQALDVLCARVAIGERLVQLAHGCAAEAVQLGENRAGFAPEAVPPPPDTSNRLLLMPDPRHFEGFVVRRLDRALGLDTQSRYYSPALSQLADDFYRWGQTADAEPDFVVDTGRGQLFIWCKPLPPDLPALERVGGAVRHITS
jgi:hypothetical protein